VSSLPDTFFSSAEIAAAGGLVDNIPAGRRREEFYRAMQRCLITMELITPAYVDGTSKQVKMFVQITHLSCDWSLA